MNKKKSVRTTASSEAKAIGGGHEFYVGVLCAFLLQRKKHERPLLMNIYKKKFSRDPEVRQLWNLVRRDPRVQGLLP